jgi:hypothetical protein
MSDSLQDPPRLKDAAGQSDLAERTASHALHCAATRPYRPAPPLARVVARMRAARSPRRLAWALAAIAFVLGLGTAAAAAHLKLLPAWLDAIVSPRLAVRGDRPHAARPRPAPVSSPSPGAAHVTAPPPAPTITAPSAPAGTPSPGAATSPAGRRVARLGAQKQSAWMDTPEPARLLAPTPPATQAPEPLPPAFAPAPAPQQPAASAASRSRRDVAVAPTVGSRPGVGTYLAESARLLRAQHAPAAALRLLDEHQAELTGAGFEHESLILRVEALLALGRRAEVLRLLDATSLTDVAASRALLITRGQLRAAANRCADALGDFELVLARSKEVDRQALEGRAACRKRLGIVDGEHTERR